MVLISDEKRRFSFASIRLANGISNSARIIAVTKGARKPFASTRPVKRK